MNGMPRVAAVVAATFVSAAVAQQAPPATPTPTYPPFPTPAPTTLAPLVHLPGLGAVSGQVRTSQAGKAVSEYLGIPYAKPPVGDLRWERPADPVSWNGTRDAYDFGWACPMSDCWHGAYESEDCLSLNVYAPHTGEEEDEEVEGGEQKKKKKLLPVMVWIHGGGYTRGCSASFATQQVVSASINRGEPVVAVSINYRLGFLGFLGSDELRGGDKSKTTGNYGVLDQRKALEFVNKYIDAFGGDPARVTIWGESAGAGSVTNHITMPGSYEAKPGRKGDGRLFQQAISQSGLASVWVSKPLESAELVWDRTKELSNCTDVKCMKEVSIDVLAAILPEFPAITYQRFITFSPVIDGVELVDHPINLIKSGHFAQNVNHLTGSLRDEYAYFFFVDPKKFANNGTESDFDKIMLPFMPPGAPAQPYLAKLKALYSAGEYAYPADLAGRSHWWWAAVRAISDHEFTCTTRRAATWIAAAHKRRREADPRCADGGVGCGANRVYSFFLVRPTHSPTNTPGSGAKAFTVPHSSDLPYVFNCSLAPPDYTSCNFTNAKEQTLASELSSYWVEFGASGSLPLPWVPRFGALLDNNLGIDVPSWEHPLGYFPSVNHRAPQCDYWDRVLELRPPNKVGPPSQA